MCSPGTSLVVQWLGLHPSTAESGGLTPGWGTKIPHKQSKKNMWGPDPLGLWPYKRRESHEKALSPPLRTEEMPCHKKPERKPSPEASPAGTMISDTQPPELCKNKHLLLKLPHVPYSIVTAQRRWSS